MKLAPDEQTALNELAHRSRWITPDTTIMSLSSAGEGNMNIVLRGRLSNGGSLIFKQSLPFVARYPQIAAPVERLQSEALFYETIRSIPALVESTPHILGFDADSHILCMSDLGPAADYLFVYQQQTDFDTLRPTLVTLLQWLSRLHAVPVHAGNESRLSNEQMRQLNHEHIFDLPWRPENGLEYSEPVAETADALQQNESLRSAITRLGDIYLGRAEADSGRQLLHGDFYPGSWVRDSSDRVMVIDPEFCFCGAPEFDVGVFCAHLTFAGFEQTEISDLLASYGPPPGFSLGLTRQFAAAEVIRRILGVARLPLHVDERQLVEWLTWAAAIMEANISGMDA
ncbi:MAG: phosphotransferase [Planctomycetaceae bacterium]|nr:phosphotransferase [Planctomycetaceae bacterium]